MLRAAAQELEVDDDVVILAEAEAPALPVTGVLPWAAEV